MKKPICFIITISISAIAGLGCYLLMITKFFPNEGPVQGELNQMAVSFLFLLLVGILIFNFPIVYLMSRTSRTSNSRRLVFAYVIINLILITMPYALLRLVDGKKVYLLSDESVSVNVPLLLASLILTIGWKLVLSTTKNDSKGLKTLLY